MQRETKEGIVKALRERIAASGSQNKLAEELGLSAAHMSNVMNVATWDKVSAQLWAQLWHETGMKLPLIDTGNFRSILELCATAQERSRMVAISADTGLGKTTALQHFCKRNEGAHYMLAAPSMNRNEFILALADALGADRGFSIHDTITKISNHLGSQPGQLIVIDDAGKLPTKAWPIIQEIRDRNPHTGIVVAGTLYLRKLILQGVNQGWNGFSEVYRRIGFWLELNRPGQEDVRALAACAGITQKTACNFISKWATNYGLLTELLENAVLAVKNGHEINDVNILRALQVGDAHIHSK